jgi:hypothetical protein
MDWRMRITLRISLFMIRLIWGYDTPVGVTTLLNEINQEISNAPTVS